jgi:hypothetical protein
MPQSPAEEGTMGADVQNDESRGIALAGMALSLGLLTALHARILSAEDQDNILEGVLASLEEFQPATDSGVQKARALVDVMAQVTAARRKESSQTQ